MVSGYLYAACLTFVFILNLSLIFFETVKISVQPLESLKTRQPDIDTAYRVKDTVAEPYEKA